jgi:excisionase family DNA binding protein
MSIEPIPAITLRVPHQVASYVGCGVRQIRAAVSSGALKTLRLGKFRLARIETVDKWIAKQETAGVLPQHSKYVGVPPAAKGQTRKPK